MLLRGVIPAMGGGGYTGMHPDTPEYTEKAEFDGFRHSPRSLQTRTWWGLPATR